MAVTHPLWVELAIGLQYRDQHPPRHTPANAIKTHTKMQGLRPVAAVILLSGYFVVQAHATFYCNTSPGLNLVFKCSDMLPYCCKVESGGSG